MMKTIAALALLASATQAAPHYTFPNLAGTAAWSSVRQTANFQSNGPVTDVGSEQIRCYERTPLGGGASGAGAPDTTDVEAGGRITWVAAPSIYHPGALSAYMARAPEGAAAADFDGAGQVWFKVFQDAPALSGGQYEWPSNGKSEVSFTVPPCLADGEYLFRVEHVALHSAAAAGGAQFYVACAQVRVSGGSGTARPSDLVAFPGAYEATDPGLMVDIYNNGGREYQPAGPAVFSC